MQGRDHSPTNSMEDLPAWFVHRTRSTGLFNTSRLKIMLIAMFCVVLGYVVTTSFGPADGEHDSYESTESYVADSTSVLGSPDSYSGTPRPYDNVQAAKYGGNGRPSLWGDELEDDISRKHTISDALSDLHNAVSNKITSWKPWYHKDQAKNNATWLARPSRTVSGASKGRPAISEEVIAPERDMLGHRTIIGKCTIVLYGSAIYERAVRTHEAHDRINGYPLHVLRQSIMDDVWSKPAYILSLLLRELSKPDSERLQWLLWVDADTIMLNPYIPIEIFLPPSPEFDDIHLLITHDWNGLNNGVFPVRVCQWSVDLFSAIVAFRHFRPETVLTFRDQSAMDMLLHEKKFAAHTVEAPQRWFNAYQGEHNETLAPFQVRRGDFLVHFAGVGNRDERILYWLDRAEQHLPDWEMEAQHTTYPTEVRDFWAEKANERKTKSVQVLETRRKATEMIMETESKLTDYQDRLQDEQKTNIGYYHNALKKTLEFEEKDLDETTIELAMAALVKVSSPRPAKYICRDIDVLQALAPLDEVIEKAHRILMKEAHETIFSAEKDIVEQAGTFNPEVNKVEEKTAELKTLVLQPTWRTDEINSAIEGVRQARVKLQEKLREVEAETEKMRIAETKAEEERKVEAAAKAAKQQQAG